MDNVFHCLDYEPLFEKGTVELWVASENSLKLDAVKAAFLTVFPYADVKVTGYNVESGVNPQPVGPETEQGALNRIRQLLAKVPEDAKGDRILIALENGIFPERIRLLKNPDLFQAPDGQTTWVDRCVVWLDNDVFSKSISEGVTVPYFAVEASEKSGFKTTCGSFIQAKYGCPHDNWHLSIGGKGRQNIMQDALVAAFKKIQSK